MPAHFKRKRVYLFPLFKFSTVRVNQISFTGLNMQFAARLRCLAYLFFLAFVLRFNFEKKYMEEYNQSQLSDINKKILLEGEVLPAIRLKDGSKVQTGTVATMLHNITLFNKGEKEAVKQELLLAIPTLFKVGLFDLFPPGEWISGNNAGRRFVGEAALEHLKQTNTGSYK
jgi:hypothetical protein